MLCVNLLGSLSSIGRQSAVWVDAGQRPTTEMCYHVVDCTYLLLDGSR